MNDRTLPADGEIVALYHARDERAIEQTARKYGDYCFTVADNILHSPQDAEECVNDTYLQAWNTMPPQRPHSLKYYLVKITRSLSITRWRENHAAKRGGGEIPLALDELEELLADTKAIEDTAARAAFADSLGRFLHALPARDRTAFVRRYFYLDATAQIARSLGVKEANVLLILSRTRAKLRAHLEKEGYTV